MSSRPFRGLAGAMVLARPVVRRVRRRRGRSPRSPSRAPPTPSSATSRSPSVRPSRPETSLRRPPCRRRPTMGSSSRCRSTSRPRTPTARSATRCSPGVIPQLAANESRTLTLTRGLDAPGGTAPTPQALLASGFGASVTLVLGGQTYQASADELLGSGRAPGVARGPGRRRVARLGPAEDRVGRRPPAPHRALRDPHVLRHDPGARRRHDRERLGLRAGAAELHLRRAHRRRGQHRLLSGRAHPLPPRALAQDVLVGRGAEAPPAPRQPLPDRVEGGAELRPLGDRAREHDRPRWGRSGRTRTRRRWARASCCRRCPPPAAATTSARCRSGARSTCSAWTQPRRPPCSAPATSRGAGRSTTGTSSPTCP